MEETIKNLQEKGVQFAKDHKHTLIIAAAGYLLYKFLKKKEN